MKKSIVLCLAICLLTVPRLNAQGGLLNKVKKSVTNDILGTTDNSPAKPKDQPEPACANDKADLVFDLGGKLQLNYYELSISVLDDGRMLAKVTGSDDSYIVKDGVAQGPYKQGDPHLADFENRDKGTSGAGNSTEKNNAYISKSGEKYLIKFGGKNYGPYARIDNFVVSKSKDKFAAVVTETEAITEDQGKKMEEAMNNAKSDQEKMELAMKYAQQVQQNMANSGDPTSTIPKLVSNIPGVKPDLMNTVGGALNADTKFDDIIVFAYDKIYDLQGRVLLNLKSDVTGAQKFFVNSDNTKYAFYKYGTLTFSDNTTLPDLFNPRLVKVNGQVSIAYMYYSPKKNAIMQWRIPF